jgi:hypothetical protein
MLITKGEEDDRGDDLTRQLAYFRNGKCLERKWLDFGSVSRWIGVLTRRSFLDEKRLLQKGFELRHFGKQVRTLRCEMGCRTWIDFSIKLLGYEQTELDVDSFSLRDEGLFAFLE